MQNDLEHLLFTSSDIATCTEFDVFCLSRFGFPTVTHFRRALSLRQPQSEPLWQKPLEPGCHCTESWIVCQAAKYDKYIHNITYYKIQYQLINIINIICFPQPSINVVHHDLLTKQTQVLGLLCKISISISIISIIMYHQRESGRPSLNIPRSHSSRLKKCTQRRRQTSGCP